MMTEHAALENLVVLDLCRVIAGPFCGAMLADLGATVIKIERPGKGDDARAYAPYLNGESLYYSNLNRNKYGITLDMKQEAGKDILRELVKKADILIENFRPGVMDRMGLGYEELKKFNPRLIYGAVSGFGSYGRYHDRPGYDIIAQAMGGLMSITGQKGNPPHPLRQCHGRHPGRAEPGHRRAGGSEHPEHHRGGAACGHLPH